MHKWSQFGQLFCKSQILLSSIRMSISIDDFPAATLFTNTPCEKVCGKVFAFASSSSPCLPAWAKKTRMNSRNLNEWMDVVAGIAQQVFLYAKRKSAASERSFGGSFNIVSARRGFCLLIIYLFAISFESGELLSQANEELKTCKTREPERAVELFGRLLEINDDNLQLFSFASLEWGWKAESLE